MWRRRRRHYINLAFVKNALYVSTPPIDNTSNVAWAIQQSVQSLVFEGASELDHARARRRVAPPKFELI